MQLKKIRVYGKLRQFLGKSYFIAAVKSPQQAMSFLIANFEGVQKHMNDQIYKIKMGGRVVTEEYLSMSGQGDIQIIPVATGSLPIVAGGILTALGGGATILGLTIGSAIAPLFTSIGTSMLIGGINDLLSSQNSTPNTSSVSDIDPAIRGSYSFSGIQNTSSSGVPIPIIYGYVYSGSILISSGVDTAQLVAVINDSGTYSQAGFVITFNVNNHGFENGDILNIQFVSGPLFDIGGIFGGWGRSENDPLPASVENKTDSTFEYNFAGTGNPHNIPTSVKEHMTYNNSVNNVIKILERVNY